MTVVCELNDPNCLKWNGWNKRQMIRRFSAGVPESNTHRFTWWYCGTHTHTHTHTHAHTHTHIHTHIRIHMHTASKHVHRHIHTQPHIHTHTHSHTHSHTRTRTHARPHTHTHSHTGYTKMVCICRKQIQIEHILEIQIEHILCMQTGLHRDSITQILCHDSFRISYVWHDSLRACAMIIQNLIYVTWLTQSVCHDYSESHMCDMTHSTTPPHIYLLVVIYLSI